MSTLLLINLLIGDDTGTTQAKGIFIMLMWLFVFIAMVVDLVSGLSKARRANIGRTSELMRRTISKVVKNYGALLFMLIIDVVIMHIGRLTELKLIENIPITTVAMSFFIIYVEYRSFRENLDDKQRTKDKEALSEIQRLVKAINERETKEGKLEALLSKLIEDKEDETDQ